MSCKYWEVLLCIRHPSLFEDRARRITTITHILELSSLHQWRLWVMTIAKLLIFSFTLSVSTISCSWQVQLISAKYMTPVARAKAQTSTTVITNTISNMVTMTMRHHRRIHGAAIALPASRFEDFSSRHHSIDFSVFDMFCFLPTNGMNSIPCAFANWSYCVSNTCTHTHGHRDTQTHTWTLTGHKVAICLCSIIQWSTINMCCVSHSLSRSYFRAFSLSLFLSHFGYVLWLTTFVCASPNLAVVMTFIAITWSKYRQINWNNFNWIEIVLWSPLTTACDFTDCASWLTTFSAIAIVYNASGSFIHTYFNLISPVFASLLLSLIIHTDMLQ